MIDRASFMADLPARLARADLADAPPLSFALVEVDPPASEAALAAVAEVLTTSIRGGDVAVRWDDGQFFVVLASSGLAGAISSAERIRETIAAGGAATVSIGVGEHVPNEPFAEVLGRATEALASARAHGRNEVRP